MRLPFLFQISYRKPLKLITFFITQITCCTILTHPTCLTRTQTICMSTRFIDRRADQGTVFTIIPMFASCKNQISASKYQYDPTFLTKKLQTLLWQFFFIILLVLFKSYSCYNTVQYTRPYNL